ncbi:unnamed protein product [Dimorphilus gyrociliatus]|uniref:G-protein coupled receptors family 1 profile domain-containing protein n=1 Tax=Dimorphilus gyrociliatus TaxID=2664684 RepID=A0A7I8V9H6_9ANNE|nr:unnamed protein product [Dimorphilus gyrociliatus]
MACYFPIKFKDLCTPLRAKYLCTALLLVIGPTIIYPNFSYIGLTDVPNATQTVCTIGIDSREAHKKWYLAEILIFRVVPIIFVAAINVCIIIKVKGLKDEKNKRKRCREKVLDKTDKASGSGKKNKVKEESATQLTIMLTVVSTSYVITYLPDLGLFISEGILAKLYEPKDIPSVTMERLIIADNAIRPLYILGFSINFFLYTVSGDAFRQQLKKILYRYFKSDRGHPHYERAAINGHTEI